MWEKDRQKEQTRDFSNVPAEKGSSGHRQRTETAKWLLLHSAAKHSMVQIQGTETASDLGTLQRTCDKGLEDKGEWLHLDRGQC